MKNILLIADAAPGLPPGGNSTATPATAPAALTVDTTKLLADLKANVTALEKDAAVLSPLLGFALTGLRGAVNAIEGHNKKTAKK
jgi:hypothetical protein